MASDKKKVLIVDDQNGIRILLAELLKLDGYVALTASCGVDALELIEQHTFDLVILDVKMPGMDGIEILARIRKAGLSVPAIMMTAYDEMQIMDQARSHGILTHFKKPFDITEVKTVVAAHFEKCAADQAYMNSMLA
jgi:two-component system, response regulator, stage 0 sporulation protein F